MSAFDNFHDMTGLFASGAWWAIIANCRDQIHNIDIHMWFLDLEMFPNQIGLRIKAMAICLPTLDRETQRITTCMINLRDVQRTASAIEFNPTPWRSQATLACSLLP